MKLYIEYIQIILILLIKDKNGCDYHLYSDADVAGSSPVTQTNKAFFAQEHRKKFNVDNQTLIDDFKDLRSYKKVGEKYGVTDNAVKKRCIKNGIIDEIQKYITSRKRLQ